ncbi:MAG: FAD-dependent oxidoreductase [Bacteroidota bacterium]
MRIAVIGGIASGPAAAAEAARQSDTEVVLFEEGEHVSVGACEIPYFVGDRLGAGADLIAHTAGELERTRGFRVFTRHRVTAIEPRSGRLSVTSLVHRASREESFDRFILATGAQARRLGIDGETAAGVFSLRDLADANRLRGWLRTEPVRHVVVVGGGYVGLELAEAMRDRGLRATILDPSGRVLASSLHGAVSGQMNKAVREAGVAVRAEQAVEILTEADGRVHAVRTERGERIGCQAVLVAIGVEPRTDLAEAAGVALGSTGAIATDAEMRTNVRGVWACGDVAETFRVLDGAPIHWPLAPVGRRTGRVAARNAASQTGASDSFRGVTPSVAVRAFGVEAACVGLREEEAREAGFDAFAVQVRHRTRTRAYPGSQPIDIRLIVERDRGRLLGGQLVAREGAALRADVLVPLIRSGATARELAEEMDLVYNPPIAPAVDPLIIAASAALRELGVR